MAGSLLPWDIADIIQNFNDLCEVSIGKFSGWTNLFQGSMRIPCLRLSKFSGQHHQSNDQTLKVQDSF